MRDPRHLLVPVLLTVVACSNHVVDEDVASGSGSIVGGQKATSIQEAVLVDASSFLCSGALIAPRVVLTAGHCVYDASSWTVTAPYAGGQHARGTRHWTSYIDGGDSVNPDSDDVAVILLDTPIQLSAYPKLARSPVPNGTKAINVGRIRNDHASYTDLYFGKPVTLRSASPDGWRFAYVSAEVIEDGDSGGPVYTTGSDRTLVAVNSGGGGGTQLLARVDLVYDKLQSLIAANGGPGGGDTNGAVTCWSPTLGEDAEEGACVQSKATGIWFQCHAGEWQRGGDAESGPQGACTSSHALSP